MTNSTVYNSEPAELGTLSALVAADVRLLQDFFAARERQMAALFGRTLRRHPVRDELMRLLVIEFAANQLRRPAYFVQQCASLATAPSVRSELRLLQHAGLIAFTKDTTHRGALLVAPTRKLIAFYNDQMPRLREAVLKLLQTEPLDLPEK